MMHMRTISTTISALALTAVMLRLPPSPGVALAAPTSPGIPITPASSTCTGVGGEAAGADILPGGGTPEMVVADTGPLPPTGGTLKGFAGLVNMSGPGFQLLAPTVPGAAALSLTSGGAVDGAGGSTFSASSDGTMLNFRLTLTSGTLPVVIQAGTVQAQAQATCGMTPTGSSFITGLTVNGVPVVPSAVTAGLSAAQVRTSALTTTIVHGQVSANFSGPAPNTVIGLPNNTGYMILNEQIIGPQYSVVHAIRIHTTSGQNFFFGEAFAVVG